MAALAFCDWDVRPRSRGISTRLILVYDSITSLLLGTPGWGRGKASMTFRRASAGTEASTEFSNFRVVTFSIRGAIKLLGVLVMRGPRL